MSYEFLGSDADSQTRELHTERCGALLVTTLGFDRAGSRVTPALRDNRHREVETQTGETE